ncbi:MAG: DUF4440 domain-containing protein [Gemmatimonadota bacterium]
MNRPMKLAWAALVALLVLAGQSVPGALAAQEPATTSAAAIAERCRGPEHRQFDFWLGNWAVSDSAGQILGHNEITRVADGCGLYENWRGARGEGGVSVNTYDPALRRWTQRWVGAGSTLWLEGGLVGADMVLSGTAPRPTPRGPVLDRITWTPLPDGRVRQVWDVSSDGGQSWTRSFAGYYARRPDDTVSAAMDAVYARFSRAYRMGEPDSVVTLYTENPLYLPRQGPVLAGRQVLRTQFVFLDRIREAGGTAHLSFESVGRGASGELGWDVGYYTLQVQQADGTRTPAARGKFTTVWRRGADGAWRIHVDGFSPAPPPAPDA